MPPDTFPVTDPVAFPVKLDYPETPTLTEASLLNEDVTLFPVLETAEVNPVEPCTFTSVFPPTF